VQSQGCTTQMDGRAIKSSYGPHHVKGIAHVVKTIFYTQQQTTICISKNIRKKLVRRKTSALYRFSSTKV